MASVDEPAAPNRSLLGGVADWARRHPVIVTLLVACIVVGGLLGLYLLPAEWSTARRLAGGLVSGGGVGLLVSATRMVG